MVRVLFFGMSGSYSALALRALVAAAEREGERRAAFSVVAVVLPQIEAVAGLSMAPPGPPFRWLERQIPGEVSATTRTGPSTLSSVRTSRPIGLPVLGGAGGTGDPPDALTTRQVARELALPLLEVSGLRDARVRAELARLAPDVAVVACLPWRVPSAVLRLPRLGILNLHPSLLPAHRGPDPLFWTFHAGQRETGVTVHLMTEALDAGAILAQERIPVPDGIGEGHLERACARAGGRLAAHALLALVDGSATPREQDESLASYDPFPSVEDYRIDGTRSARWAFDFATGLLHRPEPVWVDLGTHGAWRVLAPLAFEEHGPEYGTAPGAEQGIADEPWQIADGVLTLQCKPGVFRARVAPLYIPGGSPNRA